MIWVDGYKWPPDLHGTGSEDYLNQAWGMQENAFLRNGSSVFEGRTIAPYNAAMHLWRGVGGYQTSRNCLHRRARRSIAASVAGKRKMGEEGLEPTPSRM